MLVLQHVLEGPKVSSTARFAPLVLERCAVQVYAAAGQPLELPPLDEAWLVFPIDGPGQPTGPLPKLLVLLDGSWSQARRMFQKLEAVRRLPRLSLVAPPAPRLRSGPAGTMSTLEAIAEALAVVESPAAAAHVRAMHELVCQRQQTLRGYVGRMGAR